jgi:Transposase domain (DUF772)
MLRLAGGQVESLLDELLPVEVRQLPADLAALDRLLADPRLLAPIEPAGEHSARRHGRPTIPMGSFVRLLVIKQRTGWGYQTLVREVSDSLHLRRFCLLPPTQRVPEESTVRKLVRRLGPEVIAELTRAVIGKARRETRFAARGVRIDATVVEADSAISPMACWRCQPCGRWPGGPQARWSAAWPDQAGGGSLAADRQAGAGDLQDAGAAGRPALRRSLGAHRPGGVGAGPFDPGAMSAGRPGPRCVGVAPRPSCAQLASWMSWLTVASGSPPRSSSGSAASGSSTGWCPWATRMPTRSARARSASPTSSAASPSWLRSPPTPAVAPAATCRRRRPHPATRARTSSSTRPLPSSPASALPPRGGAGWWVRARSDRTDPGRAGTGAGVHRRAGRAGLAPHSPAAGPLPHRL